MLKKEFKRKDVDRMRNLITGNVDASSETQIGYKKKKVEYKEGKYYLSGVGKYNTRYQNKNPDPFILGKPNNT